ncbi:MAG: pseudouridine synthase, partial [Alistipes sp.]
MKDFKNDSTSTLSRFSRDKRDQSAKTEYVDRRPRLQRDADGADSSHAPRSSYNPNFTADNRVAGENRPHRSYGDKPSGDRKPYG